jgi:hypothetical protein
MTLMAMGLLGGETLSFQVFSTKTKTVSSILKKKKLHSELLKNKISKTISSGALNNPGPMLGTGFSRKGVKLLKGMISLF